MARLRSPLLLIASVLILSGGALLLYVGVQQSWRMGANLPQRAMVQDTVNELNNHKKPEDLAQGYIDMAHNMAPFIIIYDQYGKVVAGNGYLNNRIPQVPVGVLAASKPNKPHAVTWQPESNVRVASVSQPAGSYYVLGGRSLTEVEHAIDTAGKIIGLLWILSLLLLAVAYKGVARLGQAKTNNPA